MSGTRFGVPRRKDLQFFGNAEGERLFAAMVDRIAALGGKIVEIDLSPFLETARLLYEGPWVAERYVAIRDFIEKQPEALLPVTRQIIGAAEPSRWRPMPLLRIYRLKALQRASWRRVGFHGRPRSPRPPAATTRSPSFSPTRSA